MEGTVSPGLGDWDVDISGCHYLAYDSWYNVEMEFEQADSKIIATSPFSH